MINSADSQSPMFKNSRVCAATCYPFFDPIFLPFPMRRNNTITIMQQPKKAKSKITCTHSLVSATKTITTSPRPNPDIKPRHDLAVSESKTDRNPVYVGQNRFRDPRKIINQSKTPLSCISHPDRLSWPPFFVEDGNPTASYFFFANEQSRYTKPAQ